MPCFFILDSWNKSLCFVEREVYSIWGKATIFVVLFFPVPLAHLPGPIPFFIVYKKVYVYLEILYSFRIRMSEFERVSGSVATNIQKLVQNVSSMQRMMVHVDSQVHHHLS